MRTTTNEGDKKAFFLFLFLIRFRIFNMRTKGSKKKDTSEIVFDPAARKEFLTGFSKRKKERQEKARKEIEDQIKEEKQMIKDEIRKASNMHIHNAIVDDKVKHLQTGIRSSDSEQFFVNQVIRSSFFTFLKQAKSFI